MNTKRGLPTLIRTTNSVRYVLEWIIIFGNNETVAADILLFVVCICVTFSIMRAVIDLGL